MRPVEPAVEDKHDDGDPYDGEPNSGAPGDRSDGRGASADPECGGSRRSSRRYGAHATATETLPGDGEWLILDRTPSTITSVTEIADNVTTTLATNDYRIWPEGKLERLNTGTNRPHLLGARS